MGKKPHDGDHGHDHDHVPHVHRHKPHGVKREETHGHRTMETLSRISQRKQDEEVRQGLEFGLEAAESVIDRNISLFSRGHQPAFAGINTFMKAPYCEDIRKIGQYEAAFVGAPFDSATTYRPGTRFGPQAVRRIIPPLLNDFISLQKDTALVNVIGAVDAFNQAKIVASNHFNLSSVTTVAFLFVLITIPQARFVDRLLEREARRTRAG